MSRAYTSSRMWRWLMDVSFVFIWWCGVYPGLKLFIWISRHFDEHGAWHFKKVN